MLIFRGGNWREHRPWFLFTGATALAAAVWYGSESARIGRLAGGASPPGLVLGVAGGLIILFELVLGFRKKLRAVRIGRATLWLKAHLWLGLLCLPLLVLHSGFRWWGGPLATALMIMLVAVIISGIWGLALQQVLPKLMLDQVPAETIRSQIDHILGQYRAEAERAVRATCGREVNEPVSATAQPGDAETKRGFLVVGATRASGSVQGKYLQTWSQARPVAGSEPLFTFFEQAVSPYLAAKHGSRAGVGAALASSKRAAVIFQEIRTELDPAAHGVVDMLEEICDQRRQFDVQARVHGWLHGWLCVHVPLSAALFVLMVVHVYYALKYL